MKAKFFLVMGLSIMMLGACSEDSNPITDLDQETTTQGESYMNLNLKFVGNDNPGSRTWGDATGHGDSDFEDGTGEESKIKNAYVYFFNPQNSAYLGVSQATFHRTPGDQSNIESKLIATVPVEVVKNLNEGETANIIVVLNKLTNFPASTISTNSKYADFNAPLTLQDQDNAGFMMSSSNYMTEDPSTKALLNEKKFTSISKNNVAEVGSAKTPTEVNVYVERVCAKVTLNTNKDVSIHSWGLNVKNTQVYPVKELTDLKNITTQNWPGADNWNDPSRYRSYWAVDPNYSNYKSSDFTICNFDQLTSSAGASEYCLENTFDNNNQNRNQTTTAVVLAQYMPTELNLTLGTTWVSFHNRYYSENDFLNYFLIDQSIFVKKTTGSQTTYESATYADIILEKTEIQDSKKQVIGCSKWNFSLNPGTQLYKKTGTGQTENDFTLIEANNINEYLNTPLQTLLDNNELLIYVNSYCYYEIPIRHFNDSEVPLNKDGINDLSQLGRYGVVRNHIYRLNITKILKPGKPITGQTITPESKPDDKQPDHYMNVKINVLKWAVRTQNIEL